MSNFALDTRLASDCAGIGNWPLCRVLLMNEARYPWFILVPRRAGLRELCELTDREMSAYQAESRQLSRYLLDSYQAEKLNIAALGNVVPQLHIHHIARYSHDEAWPAPVWGRHPTRPYPDHTLDEHIARARRGLNGLSA